MNQDFAWGLLTRSIIYPKHETAKSPPTKRFCQCYDVAPVVGGGVGAGVDVASKYREKS